MIKRLLLLLLTTSVLGSVHASQKLLDAFTSTDPYYTSVYPSGSGSILRSIDNNVIKEGSSSLKIDYTLNAGSGNFVEIYRSYSDNTLDLSFLPDKLSIWIKGQSGNNDIFKFMLYEDQNMNGNPYDEGDEMYVFTSTSVLNSDSWTQVNMPYSSFTKLGGGTGTLDLNRIGVWRIVIENGLGNSHSSIVYIDDLQQNTTYVPELTNTPKLTGAFVQLWNTAGCNCGQWSQTQWDDQLQKMKEVCMDKLIVQYGVYGDNAWYTPSSLSYIIYENSTLDRIFKSAQAKGIKIYLGLYFDESWNTFDKSVEANYTNLLQKQRDVFKEMQTIFGSKSELEGWYIPQEINDLEWQTATKRDLLANYLQNVASYVKSQDASKKVMIAPFFGPYRPADDLQNWYEQVLSIATDIDLVYPQDGVGTTSKDVDVDIPHYFKAIKSACENKGRSFGATVESFLQTNGYPINNNSYASGPAPITNFITQLQESGKLTDELITFEWGYMQPGLSTKTQQLYDDYKGYVNCNTTEIINQENDLNVLAYPVPAMAGQQIVVNGSNLKNDGVITIINSLGIEVYNTHYKDADIINILLPKDLKSGTYILVIKDGFMVSTKKIMVQ